MFEFIVNKFDVFKNAENFDFFKSAYSAMTWEQKSALYDAVKIGFPFYKAYECALFDEERNRLYSSYVEYDEGEWDE